MLVIQKRDIFISILFLSILNCPLLALSQEESYNLQQSLNKEIAEKKNITKIEQAGLVGKLIAEKAIEKGITTVVFDRNGYLYHGRVKALAEEARKAGLKF